MAKTPWPKATEEQKNILSNSLKALAMVNDISKWMPIPLPPSEVKP